jgi:hypothetical protein
MYGSVVGVLDDPTLESQFAINSLHTIPEPDLSELVVEEDAGIEGEGWDHEVWEWNLSGSESDVEWLDVAEEGNEGSLEEESEVTEGVDHTLLREGEVSGLADHQVSPLDANDGAEISRLGKLQSFSGVADWPVIRNVGVSVESWVVLVSWEPSALGEVVSVSVSSVEEPDINLSHSGLVPGHSLQVSSSCSHVGVTVLLRSDLGDAIVGQHVFKLVSVWIVGVSCVWKRSLELRHEPERLWSDTKVVEDDKVGVHTSRGLDDTDLEVGEGDELERNEVVHLRVLFLN